MVSKARKPVYYEDTLDFVIETAWTIGLGHLRHRLKYLMKHPDKSMRRSLRIMMDHVDLVAKVRGVVMDIKKERRTKSKSKRSRPG